jgi:hypothetical protein
VQRQPNKRLAAVMTEAGISNKGLAARVKAEADRRRQYIAPDHVSVKRWLDGTRPHVDTIRCIAAALAAKLGRPITPADIGFDNVDEAPVQADAVGGGTEYPTTPAQAVNLLADLTAADLAESPELASSTWSSDGTPAVITGYLFGDALRLAQPAELAGSGALVAERIRATIKYFMDLDFQFGGGHVRKMLLFYWKTEIVPELRNDYPEPIRRAIFSAAAEAAQILGWSAYDAGRHGVAQRYFVQCLRLARAADDHMTGGRILSNLSHQANYLGQHSDAIQFARAAQSATLGKASGTVNALLFAMEARALASIGDERGTVEALTRAEAAFARRDPDSDPPWITYFDAFELAGEAAHCFRDLGKPAETAQFVAQAIDPVLTPPRTRAFIGMVSAAGALAAGDLDEALSVATGAVELAGALKSSRYLRYVSDFHRSLTAHGNHPGVREFGELIQNQRALWVPESMRSAQQSRKQRAG